MSNPYYAKSSNPGTRSSVSSSVIRAEFASIEAGFDLLPALTANKAIVVNAGGTALVPSTGNLSLGANFTVSGGAVTHGGGSFTQTFTATANFTMSLGANFTLSGGAVSFGGNFTTAFTALANVTLTLPNANTRLVGRDTNDTLTNKTLTDGEANTQAAADSSLLIATTEFVQQELEPASLVKGTGGSSTAYTLDYSPNRPLADGTIHWVQFHANSGASPTLNVDGAGAKPLRFLLTTWANDVITDQITAGAIYPVKYDLGDDAYRVMGLGFRIAQSISTTTVIDFTDIPDEVNHLTLEFEGTVATNGTNINLRTYGADGVLDSGGSDYFNLFNDASSASASSTVGNATGSSATVAGSVGTGDYGFSAYLTAANIQNASDTKFNYQATAQAAGGTVTSRTGVLSRLEADRITGVRIFSTNNMTGRFTLSGRV